MIIKFQDGSIMDREIIDKYDISDINIPIIIHF